MNIDSQTNRPQTYKTYTIILNQGTLFDILATQYKITLYNFFLFIIFICILSFYMNEIA